MPTSKEVVANRPLRGEELADIIEADVADILSQSGMLRGQIAYSRVSYEVRVILHMDNPSYPTDTTTIRSRIRSKQQVEEAPELAAIEVAPLKGASSESILTASERHREIPSPNAARVEHGLPITILRREQNGETKEQQVTYPADTLAGQMNPNPPATDIDVVDQIAAEWEGK